jgi:protein involved in polysaccharide export with SLBB domain
MKSKIAVLIGLLLAAWPAAAQGAVALVRNAPEARIQPGDVISLVVWREPDLTQNLTVPPGGVVVFPKIGHRSVVDRSVEEVTQELLAEYGRYLLNPSIKIEVLRKVQILGEVRSPGVYTLGPTVSISDAVAMAGGVLPSGRRDRVELRRAGETVEIRLAPRSSMADAPVLSGDQLLVPERSYFSQNAPMLIAALSGTLGLIVTLVAR